MLVSLQRMWLSDVATGETLGWYTDDSREQSYNTRGEVRFYAGGRQRSIGPAGTAGQWKFTLMQMTLGDVVTLKSWLANSTLILARDHRGRAMYGKFFGVDIAENKPDLTYRATITVHGLNVVDGGLDTAEVGLPVADSTVFNTNAPAENAHTAYDAQPNPKTVSAEDTVTAHTAYDAAASLNVHTDVNAGSSAITHTAFDVTPQIDVYAPAVTADFNMDNEPATVNLGLPAAIYVQPTLRWRTPPPVRRAKIYKPPTVSAVIEAGTTAFASGNTATITTASYTPSAGSLVVAYCALGNGSGNPASEGSVNDSLGATWTQLAGYGDLDGVAEIWAKDAGASPSSQTATYDPGGSGASGNVICVRWYSGALAVASQPGGTSTTGSGSTAYQISVTAASVGSFIVGAIGRAISGLTYTADANTTIIGQFNGSLGDTAALYRRTVITTATGSTTIGFSATTGTQHMAAAEIKPS